MIEAGITIRLKCSMVGCPIHADDSIQVDPRDQTNLSDRIKHLAQRNGFKLTKNDDGTFPLCLAHYEEKLKEFYKGMED